MKRPPLFLVLLTLALALLPSCTPPGGGADAKPVIYLYPEAETDVTVTLDYDGELTCVYPVMNGNSWMVTASPGVEHPSVFRVPSERERPVPLEPFFSPVPF